MHFVHRALRFMLASVLSLSIIAAPTTAHAADAGCIYVLDHRVYCT